jgi:hypothetical protein
VIFPVGWNTGYFGDSGSGVGVHAPDSKSKSILWSYAGTMSYRFLQFSHQRFAMVSHMSGMTPNKYHNADRGMMSLSDMKLMHESSRAVASPRGDSLDG